MAPIQIGDLINSIIEKTDNKTEEKTIMSITGIERLENIWSNIYAYYLDEREAHGFGNLFLKTLEHIIRRKTEKSVSLSGCIIKREPSLFFMLRIGNKVGVLTDFGYSNIIYDSYETNSQDCSFRLIRNDRKRARRANWWCPDGKELFINIKRRTYKNAETKKTSTGEVQTEA